MKYTPPPLIGVVSEGEPSPYRIWSAPPWAHMWTVTRVSDNRVMTQGDIYKCCRWVARHT